MVFLGSEATLRSFFMGCLLAGLSLTFLLFALTLAEYVGLSHRLRALSSLFRLLRRASRHNRERVPALLPTSAAAFLLGFGLIGLNLDGLPLFLRFFAANVGGFALLSVIWMWLKRLTQSLGEPISGETLLGAMCTVTLTIPQNGVGSIAYISQGKRHTMPARAETELPKGAQAIVTDVRSGVAVVETL
ncbi:MAG: NfeD family protein [Fimbriimonas sp.]